MFINILIKFDLICNIYIYNLYIIYNFIGILKCLFYELHLK